MNVPRIPESSNAMTNYSRKMGADKIIFSEFTDGTLSIINNRIINSEEPVDLQDAVTKSFADSNISTVSSPEYSIQFNDNGEFGSSANITFNDTTTTLSADTIQIGTGSGLLISNGTIENLIDPTNLQDAVTKNYVDNFFKLTRASITSASSSTYLHSEMVSIILSRDNTSGSQVEDTTADASDIISNTLINSTEKVEVKFYLRNVSTDLGSSILLSAGTGVTFKPSGTVTIYPSYELDASIIATSSTSATMLILGINYFDATDFLIGDRATYTKSSVTRITNQFNFNVNSITLTEQNVIYTPVHLSYGIIQRNFVGTKTDSFGTVSSFISGYAYSNSPINYIFSTGAVEIVIKNISDSGTLEIIASTGWTVDPNSNMTIYAGQTGMFYVYIDTVALTGKIYTIGIFNTS